MASKRKVAILGYYGYCNAGDEAFKAVFTRAFKDADIEFVRAIAEQQAGTRYVLGGGAVINSFFFGSIKKPVPLNLIGCSLPHGPNDFEILRRYPGTIESLYLRSRDDVEAARKEGFEATFIPDIVFSLEPRGPAELAALVARASVPPVDFGKRKKTIFVFLSDDYHIIYGEKMERFVEIENLKTALAAALDALCEKFDIVMPSLSVGHSARDYVFAASVVRRMKHRTRVAIIEPYIDPETIIDTIAATDSLVISMKYHGLVFGLLNKRFVINIGSTRKNLNLMADAGLDGLTLRQKGLTERMIIDAVEKHTTPRLTQAIATVAEEWRAESRAKLAAIHAGFVGTKIRA
ncbi:MAG: polysaccharide pyruvyl transferase family protein [Hyphomicrobiales bacterium]|nr:polysaccharide pyruvyl transferase family protein [Hyphomicrobiales bacterium]